MQDCLAWVLVCLFVLMTECDRTDRTCFKHTPLEMLQKNDLNDAVAGRRCDSAHPDASDGKQAAGAKGSQTKADQNI